MKPIEYKITLDDIEPIIAGLELTFHRDGESFIGLLNATELSSIHLSLSNDGSLLMRFGIDVDISNTNTLELVNYINCGCGEIAGVYYDDKSSCIFACKEVRMSRDISEYHLLMELAVFITLATDRIIPYLRKNGVIPNE